MTDLQPCSPCREGNHDTCEATGNPFCGCRKADHNGALAGPVVAPIGEVLAAGQRAPQPEMAQLPATPEALPAAPAATAADLLGAPAAPSLVDQVMGQLGTVLGLPPATMGERTIEVGELEPDDIETDDLAPEAVPDRGQAGLPDQPGPVTSAPTVPAASEGAPPAPSEAPTYDSIPMVAERDPALYASVWDSHQAHFAEELPAVGYDPEDAQDFGPDEDLNGMAGFPGSDVTVPEHAYAGTPEAPYACICGANPGTLNKLGSHLGITSDVDAMAELAKATVPHQLAASATVGETKTPVSAEGQPDDTAGLALDGSRANVPVIEAEYLDERTGTIIGLVVANGCLVEVHQEGEDTFITFTRDDRTAGPYPVAELPEATPIITYLCSVEPQTQQVEVILPGATEPLPAELTTNPLAPEAIAQALEELTEPEGVTVTTTPDGSTVVTFDGDDAETASPEPRTLAELEAAGELDVYQDEDGEVRTMATVADAVRDRLASQPATAALLDSGTPWRLVLVNGDTGMVWEALYDDDQLPTAVADTLLEHFGFAPSPLDADHPPVPPRTPPPPAPTSGTGMAGLPGPDTTRPTRVQVARIATECAACHQTIEPGEMIGYFPGTGWRHLTHA